MVDKKGQMRIQQMAFLILGLLFFFILVALFFLGWQWTSTKSSFEQLQKAQAISSLKAISGMTELSCDSSKELCVDADKLEVMARMDYSKIWQVASVKVIKVYPAFKNLTKCPAPNCNEYVVYDSGQKNVKQYSTYVLICRSLKENSFPYEKCEIGQIWVGVKLAT